MASKGPRSKLDHETRARRQRALETPKEPPRPKAHWDHVLEEMVWLSKDFEAERKWKLAQAKKVAIRASKNSLDQATRGEKKVKEEELRLRKVASNISKDVKKFWMKIEKLVHYKHQLDLEERKKKALDKQLDFLLGQTERYSTMLAENLGEIPNSFKSVHEDCRLEKGCDSNKDEIKSILAESVQDPEDLFNNMEVDEDFDIQSTEELEDDERTIEEDEALITGEERRDELATLQDEADLPLEELLKRYTVNKASREGSPESVEDKDEVKGKDKDEVKGKDKDEVKGKDKTKDARNHVNGAKHVEKSVNVSEMVECEDYYSHDRKTENRHAEFYSSHHDNGQRNGDLSSLIDELVIKTSGIDENDFGMQDIEYVPLGSDEELDDETTLAEEEEMTRKEKVDSLDEITLLQQESEMPIDELLARYRKDTYNDDGTAESECSPSNTDDMDCVTPRDVCRKDSAFTLGDDGALKLEVPVEHKEQEPPVEDIETKHDGILDGREGENIIADAAAAARSAQPTGNTFLTTKVRTKFPFLLKYPLREYQHIGLDWLVTMYEKRLNGILADEMGLGKTIMTIALLAHLACEKGIWGPHLIVVPTSVMLNWETEFLKWCPAFKILTYFGSAKERKHKRQGWLKPNSFHVCITTYRLVIQDSKVFKRKKWKYLILDEAHLIKNWKSQRWQTLLNFNSKRRILLTGTPLQNDLMELWSLMHFLMPHIFQSHQEFKDWFCNPISGMVEGQEKVNRDVVDRLHNVLRPFILRRLKRDVEKQLPEKHQHVIYCRLSKRQRNLYEDFIASSETQATLASSNYFGMISVIMQLRKVCNHPDLFEGRPIISSFDMAGIDMQISSSICSILSSGPFSEVDLKGLNFVFTQHEFSMTYWEIDAVEALASPVNLVMDTVLGLSDLVYCKQHDQGKRYHGANIFEEIQRGLWEERVRKAKERALAAAWWNSLQCHKKPVYGTNLRELVTIKHPVFDIHGQKNNPSFYLNFSSKLADIVLSPVERLHVMLNLIECFMFAIPAARAPPPICWCSKGRSPVILQADFKDKCTWVISPLLSPIRPAIVRRQVYFPDRRLIQFDCGKLQELAVLLRRLKSEGHRALIFTQMTKMLDILEAFINLYGYTYMRLDGSTQPEERQTLMQRFNTNPKFFLFILSTRSGGVGINLVGADTVIFYDSDWNPAMDQQAQDRCHRIGQTREVHIYRLISDSTIEENILKKANQKRVLDDLVIQSGSYNTEFFKKLDPIELFSGHRTLPVDNLHKGSSISVEYPNSAMGPVISTADVEAAIKQAEDEADYMALKKVQQEEDVDKQEFAEEAIGRLEDGELINEDDMRNGETINEDPSGCTSIAIRDSDATLCGGSVNEENAITLAGSSDDIDMLADVKQMVAAAAAAGHASSSFENQLRPIDRYAMRFLELWDPIIDKSAIEFPINVEEEWELDRIEKFKEDLEAEIDEDQEPFLYERWDADFATTAYRQHVEALAQRQMMEELEYEAQEANNEGKENYEVTRCVTTAERKTKSKKKLKKTKFKSLKKGPLTSESAVHEEPSIDEMPVDDKVLSPDVMYSSESPPCSPPKKKRKKVIFSHQDEKSSRKNLKSHKKVPVCGPVLDSNSSDKQIIEIDDLKSGEGVTHLDIKSACKSKTGGKISITVTPVKRVMLVKPERLKKRGHIWSRDCFPSPDSWSFQEDAVLCAIVHEYSTHWELVSDSLYTMPGGGLYRGRFRHPVHCCERFRELFSRYVLSATDTYNVDKINSGPGKALLKVTEDHVRMLLNVTSELPDNELLLQKHFMAIRASVWTAKCRLEQWKSTVPFRNGFYSSRFYPSSFDSKPRRLTEKMNLITLGQSSELVMTALISADSKNREDSSILFSKEETPIRMDMLDLTLNIPPVAYGDTFPSVVNVSIHAPEPPPSADEPQKWMLQAESSCRIAENRFRLASEACFEGEGSVWASSAFSTNDVRCRTGPKSQTLGKHKAASYLTKHSKAKVPRTAEPDHESAAVTNVISPSPGTAVCADDIDLLTSSHIIHDSGTDFQSQMGESIVPHEYDPDFIADLEDLGPPLDITDIG